MRFAIVALAGLLTVASLTTARAEAPNPIASLLGPAVGYKLFQNDLCGWGLSDKIKKTYKDGFAAVGMTAAQQAAAWAQAADTQTQMMAKIPANRKAKMKADTCTAASLSSVKHDLGD